MSAQTITTNSVTGATPATLAPGAPAGTYRLNGIENINLYNGHLSVSVPLMDIRGRGEAGYTVMVGVTKPPWTVNVRSAFIENGVYWHTSEAESNAWDSFRPRYAPGTLIRKRAAAGMGFCASQDKAWYTKTATHFVFYAADGSEHPLYNPTVTLEVSGPCNAQAAERTPFSDTFKSEDGSGLTFKVAGLTEHTLDPDNYTSMEDTHADGVLLFPSGMRYTIEGGAVTEIRDRNGNRVQLEYSATTVDGQTAYTNAVSKVTDSLGRETTFMYDRSSPGLPECADPDHPVDSEHPDRGLCDKITFKGAQNQGRTIWVKHNLVQRALSEPDPDHINDPLFPEFDDYPVDYYDIWLVTEIFLPNGSAYRFRYNRYGELTRMLLPTGGVVDYVHDAGVTPNAAKGAYLSGQLLSKLPGSTLPANESTPPWRPQIYRRLKERLEYASVPISGPDQNSLSSRTVYPIFEAPDANAPSFFNNTSYIWHFGVARQPYASVLTYGNAVIGDNTATETRHYFYTQPALGSSGYLGGADVAELGPAANLISAGSPDPMATVGGDPMTGREYQTEIPGVSRTTQVFKPFLSEAKVCQENVSELDADGNAITTSGKIFVYQEYPKPFPNMTDVYDYGFDQAPGITYGTTAQNVMYATCAAPVTGYARHTHTDYVESAEYLEYTPAGENIPISQLRTLPAAVVVKDGSGSRQSETRYFYDGQGGTGVCSYSPPLASAAGITMHDDEKYGVGSTTPRGNQTCAAQWLNTTPEQWLTTKTQFDIAGNAVRVEDARGNPTQYRYETNCSFGPSNTYAFPTAITNALNQTTTIQYDCGLGKPDKITDANNRKTTFTYGFNDPLDRLTSYTEAFGEQAARTTDYVYTSTPPYYGGVTTRLDATKAGVHTAVEYDGLGRERASLLYDGESIVSQVDTKYNAQGLIWKVSNPHTGGASAVTETLYDGAGRVVTVKRPGNSAATTSYAAVGGTTPLRTTTMTDEASSSRVLYYDAFGRLQRLVEDPGVQPHLNYETTYAYDALGNLTDVVQGGQTRHFAYDSLGRLLSANNPESGTTTYSYDESGNLVRKIAAGGVATCFWPSAAGGCSASALHSGGYDALNRPVVKRYSDGTPAVKWCYDGNTYSDGACQGGEVQGEKGYLTAVGNYVSSGDTTWTISSSEYKHQALGLVKWSKQVTGGNAYKFEDPTTPGDGGYVYDNGGRLTAMWYPSGRKVTYEYDGAGRVNVVGGQLGTNTVQYTSASNKISYAPHGAPVSVTFGNGLQETVRFNERLQPDLMQAGLLWKLENFYCPDGALTCTGNNGNILRQKVTVNGSQLSMQQDYTYDALNRLRTAEEANGGWQQTYVYDATGNRALLKSSTVDSTMWGGTQFTPTVATDTAAAVSTVFPNNQWTAARYDWDAVTGTDYAAGAARSGNITALGGIQLRYDAENRQISATNNATTTYAYDGEGRRVSKTVGGVTIHYVYDASGQLAAEYGSSAAPGLQYLTVDHLGSTRLVTGAELGQTPIRYDYLPFGEEIPAGTGGRTTAMGYSSATGPTQKFTGKERDSELAGSAMQGLDYFGERYFSAAQGRFTTPDSMLAKKEWLADPQRWNKYAYVRNNPLRYIDPNGEDLIVYTFYGQDLTEEQKKYLQANMKQIQASIAEKFKKAGVDKVEFRDGSTLSQKQIAKILQNGQSMDTTGIGLLNFANKSIGGYASGTDTRGVTASDSRSAVFLGRLQPGLDLSNPNDASTMDFRVGEVGAHELGHGQGFESDSATWNFVKSIFGQGNLMGEGQGMPSRPKNFDPTQDKTQRAIREINKIGDNTPKP